MRDGSLSYKELGKHFASHQFVDHDKEYVRGIIHTNFAEPYHSLWKRGIFGTFHHVSPKHLPMNFREFEFRWNSRNDTDRERAVQDIKQSGGKRLMYREPAHRRGRATEQAQISHSILSRPHEKKMAKNFCPETVFTWPGQKKLSIT